MGRGADETTGGQAPPRRNPFRQEISEDSSGKIQGIRSGWREGAEKEGDDLANEIREGLLSYFDRELAPNRYDPQKGQYVKVDERLLKPFAYNPKYGDGEAAVELEMEIKKHNSEILANISSTLDSHAGDDLDLASKLEALLSSEGESLFYLEQSEINGTSYWVHSLSEAPLERFLRNMKRTILLHRRDGAQIENSDSQKDRSQKEERGEEVDGATSLKEAEAEVLKEAQERQREAEYTAYRIENF